MNTEIIITCAVTGAGDTVGMHPAIPVTPEQIADACIEAADAGAAVVHIHVRDPETGQGSRELSLYRAAVDRVRASGRDVLINLTAGMGGDLMVDETDPNRHGSGTDLAPAPERMIHVEALRPEICTLDCGSMNFGEGSSVVVNTPATLRTMAAMARDLGVKPEMEVFDTGQLWFARRMVEEGLIPAPPMFQFCLGIPWGAPADTNHMKAMQDALPPGAIWAGFGISRWQMPMVAQAMLLGGHVRVGLEDNLYLERGVHASNGQLVEKAARIVRDLGGRHVGAGEARRKLGLPE